METLYYFNYNNYVNRIVKGYATLNEYIQNGTLLGSTNKASFNKLSDIEAEATFISESSPDYCVAVDKYGNIESRWFVTGEQRKNYTNLKLNLKRDSTFDRLNIIVQNPDTLIVRGFPNGTSDGSILNREDFNFNAYKQLEVPIYFDVDRQIKSNTCPILALFISNKTAGKIGTTYPIYASNEEYGGLNSYPDSTINFNGEYGYNIILIPYIVLDKAYKDYKVKTNNFNKIGDHIYVEGTNVEITDYMTCGNIASYITNEIIPNEGTVIDVQVLPNYGYYDYEIDDDNDVITCYYNSSYMNGSSIFKSGTVVSSFVTTGKVDIELWEEVKLSQLIGNDNLTNLVNEGIMGIKKLERYKVYIQSPDRSSNIEIDLKKYFKGLTALTNSTYITLKVYCKYQPYQSFIYISPDNVGYFGCNTKDGEYLICGYNNQILRTTDAWKSFLLNNKNYLNSFNLEMRDSYINTATGAITGAISGATTGALVGGGAVGAVVGGVVGGTASLVQGLVNTNEKRQQFEWTIDNIKSKPQSVAKVASFVNINSIYPTIRVCYNSEDNFDEYLKLNNCKISKIGPINNYVYPTEYPLYTYIVADLIKLETFNGTADELLEIQNELKRGLYFEVKSI